MNKIFVQIASYRDPELNPTVIDCLLKAKYPERLTFGICRQYGPDEEIFKYSNDVRFRVLNIDAGESKGCCWARSKVQNLYKDEKYTLQIDSHHRFAQNWDEELINMLALCPSSKPIITVYPPPYDPSNDTVLLDQPLKMIAGEFAADGILSFKSVYLNSRPDRPIPARFMAGGFFFTYGTHCLECKYDGQLYFSGEEITLTVRSFTHGYDLYHPHKTLIWHNYTPNTRRRHWEDHTEIKKTQWWDLNAISIKRIQQLFGQQNHNINLGIYGFGTVRTLHDYEIYSGIDFKRKGISKYTQIGKDPPNPLIPSWEEQIAEVPHDSEYKLKLKLEQKRGLSGIKWTKDHILWKITVDDVDKNCIYTCDLKKRKKKIRINFLSNKNPDTWNITPLTKSKGLLEKIQFKL